jgi:hypothetical protein
MLELLAHRLPPAFTEESQQYPDSKMHTDGAVVNRERKEVAEVLTAYRKIATSCGPLFRRDGKDGICRHFK